MIAVSGEAAEGPGSYRDRVVRYGDTTSEGMREKARWVLAEQDGALLRPLDRVEPAHAFLPRPALPSPLL